MERDERFFGVRVPGRARRSEIGSVGHGRARHGVFEPEPGRSISCANWPFPSGSDQRLLPPDRKGTLIQKIFANFSWPLSTARAVPRSCFWLALAGAGMALFRHREARGARSAIFLVVRYRERSWSVLQSEGAGRERRLRIEAGQKAGRGRPSIRPSPGQARVDSGTERNDTPSNGTPWICWVDCHGGQNRTLRSSPLPLRLSF